MSMHAVCTAVFVAVALVITFIFASIQTLDKIAWLTWSAVFGLVAARECLSLSPEWTVTHLAYQSSSSPSVSQYRIDRQMLLLLVLGKRISRSLASPVSLPP